jgi:secondary thiamine-phosphate synthase enzyme
MAMLSIQVRTPSREILMDVTHLVAKAAADLGLVNGAVLVAVPHTTAGVLINENADPEVPRDILGFLSDLVPRSRNWRHTEGNSDAHVKSVLVGSSVLVPVVKGGLSLGTWQGIFFAEFDGPRTREIRVSALAST